MLKKAKIWLLGKKTQALQAGGLTMLSSSAVNANGVVAGDDFFDFYDKVNGWSTSGLGVGLSISALLAGAVFGIAKSTPLFALVGLILAAIISFGPGVIVNLVTGGMVI